MITGTPGKIYQQMEVNSSNELQLVVMLYEGAIRFLSHAKKAIQERDLVSKAQTLDRAFAIIGELQSTLKVDEGGEIAASLDKLYTYMTERLLEASAKLDHRPIDEVINLLQILNSAWSEISQGAEVSRSSLPIAQEPLPAFPSEAGGPRSALEVFG